MLVIGHRGAPYYAPENTILSFEKALEMGLDMIELDVHICSSGEVVVIHDDTVDRTTDGSGKVSELCYGELRELDAGGGERIPSLKEALDHVRGKAAMNIELKGKGTAGPVWDIVHGELINDRWRKNDLLISSFGPDELFEFSDRSGDLRIGYIFEDHADLGLEFAREIGAWSIHPGQDLVDQDLIKKAHAAEIKVVVWVVNDPAMFLRMRSMGVDGIFTDRPDVYDFEGEDK